MSIDAPAPAPPAPDHSHEPLSQLRSAIAAWALFFMEGLIIDSPMPDRMGRYLVIDTHLAWQEGGGR